MLDLHRQKELQTMDNIIIEKMKIEDIDNILDLEKSHNITILTKNMIINDLKSSNNYYIVARTNEKIIGYCAISYVMDSADITSIVVSKEYTRQGIASLLLENVLSFSRKNGIKTITLEVRKSNIPAQNLYSKFGFRKISERKKYYDNIEDAYIMQKKIPI